jgi:NAD(P)-dependent dehydrogenase (short-subunit alcohol dehydrogenase family)
MHKRILLTGASGGLGMLIAKNLLDQGHFLGLLFHSQEDKLKALATQYPDQTALIKADLSQDDSYETIFNVFPNADVLIHAAGIASSGMSWKIPPKEFDRVNKINYFAPFYLSQCYIPNMRLQKWGRIIFFSSIVAQKGVVGTSAYSASKSALIGLSKTMAVELGASGITVNAIAPGYMDSGMIREVSDEMIASIKDQVPSHTLGDPQGIVALIDLLLKDNGGML